MTIRKEEGTYAILRFDPESWAASLNAGLNAGPATGHAASGIFAAALSPGSGFFSLTKTADEVSLVCREDILGACSQSDGSGGLSGWQAAERGWKLFRVSGQLDFGLTGILASIAVPLAARGISIFAVSTYDTDWILVKSAVYEAAAECLAAAGFGIV